ncbi:hypothetical protein AVEN_126721-1 [Araneus ventricosus]|uniref:Uncharacterized protein n=1 Tax=Araneus ventricosus TaxID=182803 RepID=A0A4Y2KWZ3_ARAVE|nr:hypothetical protein AVEN_126721-1 [Araneus ventricosus]
MGFLLLYFTAQRHKSAGVHWASMISRQTHATQQVASRTDKQSQFLPIRAAFPALNPSQCTERPTRTRKGITARKNKQKRSVRKKFRSTHFFLGDSLPYIEVATSEPTRTGPQPKKGLQAVKKHHFLNDSPIRFRLKQLRYRMFTFSDVTVRWQND